MGRAITIRAAAALLAVLLSSAADVGSAPLRQVQIGWGCIELPATSRVVWLRTSVIDQSYGYIDVAGHPRIEWSFGFSERHPLCHKKCVTVWQREETLGGQKRQVGLMRDAGKRVYFVTEEWLSFRVDANDEATLEYLRDTVATYHRREDAQKCEQAEREERAAPSNYGLQPTDDAPSWWASCPSGPLRAAGG